LAQPAGTICPSCGVAGASSARFCAACGAKLDRPAGREGRKVVTALFPDIVGSTSLSERMDPEDFDAVIRETIARMTTVAENYGGEVHELRGDGLLALFGAAITHEDDPERAVLGG
jgi:class 3 adenylate cyclase